MQSHHPPPQKTAIAAPCTAPYTPARDQTSSARPQCAPAPALVQQVSIAPTLSRRLRLPV
ncbi:predicted protein [Plenodomus lingam JN3]|uniref:Predicted protein n=1 Tax=Leptosphaeria maculans (strain JN3 / isolate v23.1.3 / race Av1-4-5-6-7-8) TaxID=985895 RepID=E4ZV19_LEPMJ|nr:predicted protein [Plenodomus lingam JN3]CBX95445.1 predicted protein [Plenodomus lingam JN3]